MISQLQPLFIDRRDIYEARAKKSKMYHWVPSVTGLIVSKFPYLLVCDLLYYVCWYFTAGLPTGAEHAGSVFFVVVILHPPQPSPGHSLDTADNLSGDVRMPLHWNWTDDRRVYSQRSFCVSRQPSSYHNSRFILRRHDTVQPD